MEGTLTIFGAIKASNWFKTVWTKRSFIEFKKEAFMLFEGLLIKIKKDLIKFLLNLNIVVSSEEEEKNSKELFVKEKSEKK